MAFGHVEVSETRCASQGKHKKTGKYMKNFLDIRPQVCDIQKKQNG